MNANQIKTITGWINKTDITGCYVHEHLYTEATPEIVAKQPEMAVTDLDKIVVDLKDFALLGGNCIVDVTTIDYGRSLEKLKELAIKSGVYVVATGGFNKGKFNQSFLEDQDPQDVANRLLEEINQDVGPGVLKIGTSLNRIESWELVGLKAISMVHLKTGIPITTHTEKGTFAQEQLDLFKKEDVNPSAIILGHLDQNPDFDLHVRLVKQGAFLGYDSIPKTKYDTKQRAMAFIAQLAKLGLHTQIVVSGDFARSSYYIGYNGKPGLKYLLSDFKQELVDYLTLQNLDAQQIVEDIFINNPARALAFRF
jgi:predicted metal-dependent phosphotriesterase family hydrolase